MATHTTRPPPPDWPRISSAVFYEDPAAAIDWLARAFGFVVRLRIEGEGGRIEYSELVFGDGLVMVSDSRKRQEQRNPMPSASPRAVGGAITQALCVCVDDADAHCAQAREAGARIVDEPTTVDYGEEYWADRSYRAEDPEGHHWWFMQRVRNPGGDAR